MYRLIAIFTILILSLPLMAADFKNDFKKSFKGKTLYVTYNDGLWGISAGSRSEHTYIVRPDKSVEVDEVWGHTKRAGELISPGTAVEIRSVDVKNNRIEMTIRTVAAQALGTAGMTIGMLGGMTSTPATQLEVNLKFEVGKAPISEGEVTTINEFLNILVSENPPTFTLDVGMKIDEVVKQLGQPSKIIKTGNQELYVYPDLRVMFVNGEVKEVKF